MTSLEVIIKAREIISDRKHWTYGASARDKNSKAVDVDNPKAVRFCAVGSLIKAKRNQYPHEELRLMYKFVRNFHPGYAGVSSVNDGLGHEAVLKVFDKAIEDLQCQQSLKS